MQQSPKILSKIWPVIYTALLWIQMYDGWVEAAENGELTGVCMLYMSAAFDVVDLVVYFCFKKSDCMGLTKDHLNR